MGDERAVNGLIEYERERQPEASEEALMTAALQRLVRDRR
jgi:hypothetical protein